MKITIDNLDGSGALDYTNSLSGAAPLMIERKLNQPSSCTLSIAQEGLPVPPGGAHVVVTADNEVVLFTGYTIAAPARSYAGMGTTGPNYLLQLSCLSDEVILDARVSEKTIECVATPVIDLLTKITGRATTQSLAVSGDATSTRIGGFQPLAGKSWSANVGALANAARASYRVVNNAVLLESVGDVVHALVESDGSFNRSAFKGSRSRLAVNDVTVCGKEEPQAYVTEIFEGDGITSIYQLSEAPFMEKATLLFDTFTGSTVDTQRWVTVDGGGHVSLTSRGLTLGGSQGAGAASSVVAVDAVEMGGVLLIELTGLEVDSLGEGYFAGLSSGAVSPANLAAAFHVRPNGTSTVVAPIVLGVEAGVTTTLQSGHTYTLRLRFHCKDRQRALQTYTAGGENGPVQFGGQTLTAEADLVMEVQETTGGAQFPVVVLYDGSMTQAPASCTPVVVDSVSFLGSIASFELTRPGDVWVNCTPAGSAAATQRLGASAQTSQAKIMSTGRMSFYPGNVPAEGTVIRISYRIGGRAVTRMTAPTSSPVSSLILTAEHPVTRSSADCENAALALLATSTWSEGAWKGTYTCWNPHQTADIWPGDLLQVDAPSADISTELLVRSIQIRSTSCAPELLSYTVAFANEWAESLSLKMNEGAPLNAWLPPTALTNPTALVSARDLSVSSVSTTQIQVQAGLAPPSGGGFEVRRSDWKFGAGDGADLVLRSPVPNFTIVREAPVERYYVRMYDGAAPPNYSRFSSAIFVSAATQ
ncbi:MAG TPA: hypothetical protein VF018_07920 [Acidobacteriaceae bacterium]